MRGADIVARVRFYASDKGGRLLATPRNIFRCLLGFKGELFDCGLILDQTGPVSPGDEVVVPLILLNPSLIKNELKVGSHFTLWEMKTIAIGVVEEVLPDEQ